MTVVQLQSHPRPAVRWTEVCPDDHRGQGAHLDRPRDVSVPVRPTPAPRRSLVRPEGGRPAVTSARAGNLVRPRVAARPATVTSVAPGRRVLVRPVSTDRVRACHVEAPVSTGVVDDVPAWALLACGIAFGVIMLLAVAFLGGPAYA